MSKRKILLALIVTTSLIALAGCSTRVGTEDPNEQVVRSDQGVEVVNLEVFSEGERDCYHTLEAEVTNTNDFAVENLELEIQISDENGQVLSTFTTGYVSVESGETKDLEVEHGPQKNQCWFSGDAADYHLTVSYDSPEGNT